MKKKKHKLPKHYYNIHTEECVLCGRSSIDKIRAYGKKPKNTHHFRQTACGCHFYE